MKIIAVRTLLSLSATFLLLPATAAAADVFRLGGGRKVEGKLIKETSEAYFVDIGFTIVSLPKKSVTKHLKDEAKDHRPGAATKISRDLYSTVDRDETTVKENVKRTASCVVMVQTPSGLGSGFIITKDGYLITNDHVVQGETKLTVVMFEKDKSGKLNRRKVKNVKIVATNAYLDLALLKIEGEKNLPHVYMGDVKDMRVGETVYAIGNPLGLERSVSRGIVSLKNRPFEGLVYVQTTTQINPGNSGGPLFNMKGEVVGVTNMGILSGQGLNFAIPVSVVKGFLRNRDAFLYDKDNPNTGYRYLPPPKKPGRTPGTGRSPKDLRAPKAPAKDKPADSRHG